MRKFDVTILTPEIMDEIDERVKAAKNSQKVGVKIKRKFWIEVRELTGEPEAYEEIREFFRKMARNSKEIKVVLPEMRETINLEKSIFICEYE